MTDTSTADMPGSPASPCAWRPIASAPRDGSWVVVHARECGQPFGPRRLMLARFEEIQAAEPRGWNNERPSGWRGVDLAGIDPAGTPGDLLDVIPTVFLDPKTRIRWP